MFETQTFSIWIYQFQKGALLRSPCAKPHKTNVMHIYSS